MEKIQVVNDVALMGGLALFFALLLLTIGISRIDGFTTLLAKAFGTVVQQVCSLVIEAVCLIFKIVNSLEIYIVLLIDALTGKTSSHGKIASLAIGVLSVASFYTTYSGMGVLVEQETIAFLITLGIQAILLSTSLRINDVLNLDRTNTSVLSSGKNILKAVITCLGGCLLAYLTGIVNLSYSLKKNVYYILYIIIIVTAVIAVFSLIRELIEASIKNTNIGIFLFAIYFVVLSVSSFFSYNAFVPIMYPENMQEIDNFYFNKIEVIALLEQADKEVDVEYYEEIREVIEADMKRLEQELKELDITEFLTEEEKVLYNRRLDFEEYLSEKEKYDDLSDELEQAEENCVKIKKEIIENSGGIGPNTRALYDEEEKKYRDKEAELAPKIGELEKKLDKMNITETDLEAYMELVTVIEEEKDVQSCSEEIDLISLMLKRDNWSITEANKVEKAAYKLENARMNVLSNSEGSLNNNIWDMVKVFHEYKEYQNIYSNCEEAILVCNAEEGYFAAYNQIQIEAYKILSSLPETKYIFTDSKGELLQTEGIRISEFYSKLEQLQRNRNTELSTIERNLRIFISNKMVGIVCAVMALLIDMMILFVGIILPKNICLENKTAGRYTEQEMRRILSNLFNKPIGR